jgi:hypothetical protein
MQLSIFFITHIVVDVLLTSLNMDFSIKLLFVVVVKLDILFTLYNHGIFLVILFQVVIAIVFDHDLTGVDALMEVFTLHYLDLLLSTIDVVIFVITEEFLIFHVFNQVLIINYKLLYNLLWHRQLVWVVIVLILQIVEENCLLLVVQLVDVDQFLVVFILFSFIFSYTTS